MSGGEPSLHDALARRLKAGGPLYLDEYAAFCLHHEAHGYYRRHNPFLGGGGRGSGAAEGAGGGAGAPSGDFTTSPQISQAFGEILGAWLAERWQGGGFTLAELGPGTGALFADLWRAAGQARPTFLAAAEIALVESNETLARVQDERLAALSPAPKGGMRRFAEAGSLPDGPLFLVANEFLDALPARQYVMTEAGWRERAVTLAETDGADGTGGTGGSEVNGSGADGGGADDMSKAEARALAFCLAPARPPFPPLPSAEASSAEAEPEAAAEAAQGAVRELCPAASAVVSLAAEQIARAGGAALFIDYGYQHPPGRSTFSAVRGGQPADPLQRPGETDLSFFVDFAALEEAVRRAGAKPHVMRQDEFLLAHGLRERAAALGASEGPQGAKERTEEGTGAGAEADALRLIDPEGLGGFLVLQITPA